MCAYMLNSFQIRTCCSRQWKAQGKLQYAPLTNLLSGTGILYKSLGAWRTFLQGLVLEILFSRHIVDID